MAKNDPLFGDIKAQRNINDMSNVGWMARLPNPSGGYYGGDTQLFSGNLPGIDPTIANTGYPMYSLSDLTDFTQGGGSYVDWTGLGWGNEGDVAFDENQTYHAAQAAMNNPAFATYFHQFGEGESGTAPAEWWNTYGRYFSGLEKPGSKKVMTQRKGHIEAEDLTLKALKSLDKTKGFSSKTGFAGDGGFLKAQKSLQEESIRQSDLSKLGVESSLWDIHQNYMSNIYSQFAALAGLGAFEDE